MPFKGFDPKDGADLYDTKQEAIDRAKMLIQWRGDPSDRIMVHREWMPLWIAHLFRAIGLSSVGYKEVQSTRS